jgi:hypothetical protein
MSALNLVDWRRNHQNKNEIEVTETTHLKFYK